MKKNTDKKRNSETALLEVYALGNQGDLVARPVDGPAEAKIYVVESKRIKPALEIGDRFIGRLIPHKGSVLTKPVARTAKAGETDETEKIFGIIEKRGDQFYLKSTDRKARMNYLLDTIGKCKEGDFVAVMLIGDRKFKQAKIIRNYGVFDLNKVVSCLVLEKYNISSEFPEAVKKEASCCPQFSKEGRVDLTSVPLVTIDGDDSKDFDDAVYAEKTASGFNLIVAIADVAFYVRHLSELDREAYRRGNSVYLPNMVVPMLPEELSNDLCSLKPKVERAAIACFMSIDKNGNLKSYEFKRAVIKSAARLTYTEVQNAFDGKPNAQTVPLFKNVIQPLYEAYFALDKAKKKRGALELDIPEVKIKIGKDGLIQSVCKAEHLISHSLVEEFMINANVAAAKVLFAQNVPVMYRVHEKPIEDKLKEIEPLLHDLGLKLPEQPELKPEHFNKLLAICAEKGFSEGICNLILRLQAQARYTPEHLGHFGLGLADYAHFTSPIRRYADLLIHRALIKAYHMPDGGGLEDGADNELFTQIGEHISAAERRAVSAERDTVARFLSAYLQPAVGSDFDVKVSGMSTAGLFVAVESLGAEGLIPMRTLPDDDYRLAPGGCELSGIHTGRIFGFGDIIKARLVEASPITGGLIFKFVDENEGVDYYEKGSRGGVRPEMPKPEKSEKDKAERKKGIKARNKKNEVSEPKAKKIRKK